MYCAVHVLACIVYMYCTWYNTYMCMYFWLPGAISDWGYFRIHIFKILTFKCTILNSPVRLTWFCIVHVYFVASFGGTVEVWNWYQQSQYEFSYTLVSDLSVYRYRGWICKRFCKFSKQRVKIFLVQLSQKKCLVKKLADCTCRQKDKPFRPKFFTESFGTCLIHKKLWLHVAKFGMYLVLQKQFNIAPSSCIYYTVYYILCTCTSESVVLVYSHATCRVGSTPSSGTLQVPY